MYRFTLKYIYKRKNTPSTVPTPHPALRTSGRLNILKNLDSSSHRGVIQMKIDLYAIMFTRTYIYNLKYHKFLI